MRFGFRVGEPKSVLVKELGFQDPELEVDRDFPPIISSRSLSAFSAFFRLCVSAMFLRCFSLRAAASSVARFIARRRVVARA